MAYIGIDVKYCKKFGISAGSVRKKLRRLSRMGCHDISTISYSGNTSGLSLSRDRIPDSRPPVDPDNRLSIHPQTQRRK